MASSMPSPRTPPSKAIRRPEPHGIPGDASFRGRAGASMGVDPLSGFDQARLRSIF